MGKYSLDIDYIKFNNIFLLSDVHFGVRGNSLEWLHNHLDFFRNFYIPYIKRNYKPGDVLFFLGDWFDNRQLLDIYVMNSSADIVMELASILPVYFIVGNHDIYKKDETDVNSIRAFKYIPGVVIYEKPVIVSNGESKILLLPWIGDTSEEEKYIKHNEQDYVFAHTTISGFRYDNNRQIHNGANFTKLGGIKRLFSGHIHKRQDHQQFTYIGCPFSTKRSDINNKKGVYLFKPSSNEVEFTENNYSPVFQKIKLEDILEYRLDYVHELLNNNYTDIIIPDKLIHKFNLSTFINILEGCNYKKIEAGGEKSISEEDLSEVIEDLDIKDILSLLEMSIEELDHNLEVIIKLKMLNKEYYEKASKSVV